MNQDKNSRLGIARFVIFVAALALLTGPLVLPGHADQDDAERTLFEFVVTDIGAAAPVDLDVITVPEGERLVITDVLVTFTAAFSTATGTLLRDGQQVSRFRFTSATGNIYQHRYVSGIEFLPGETLTLQTATAASAGLDFELRGFIEPL